jgi:hypothetical protein
MNTKMMISFVFGAILGCSNLAIAQAQKGSADQFKPFKMSGEWTFVSSNTGRKYGGDASLDVKEIDGGGKMRGIVSFDGRQTNDNCSTKGVFSDEPAQAEVLKTPSGYLVSFMLNCSRGESPRSRTWELTCESGVCTRPEVLPNGKGMLTLKE